MKKKKKMEQTQPNKDWLAGGPRARPAATALQHGSAVWGRQGRYETLLLALLLPVKI